MVLFRWRFALFLCFMVSPALVHSQSSVSERRNYAVVYDCAPPCVARAVMAEDAPVTVKSRSAEQRLIYRVPSKSLVLEPNPFTAQNELELDLRSIERGFDEFVRRAISFTTEGNSAVTDELELSQNALAGEVYHWAGRTLLADVEVGADAGTTATTVTGVDGRYQFNNLSTADYSVKLTKASDTDATSTISSADALAALKISVGLNPNTDPDGSGPLKALPVSPYQLMAADMNGDGRVTSSDALAILKTAVGLSDALDPYWVFVAEETPVWNTHVDKNSVFDASSAHSISYPAQTTANFVGVLVGDVNSSWAAPENSSQVSVESLQARASKWRPYVPLGLTRPQ